MRSDKKNNGAAPLIVTIATAALAAAAVVILLISMGTKRESDNSGSSLSSSSSGFAATSELYSECENAAKELASANYEVIRLFVTEGLPLKSVYGKDPEPIDGVYMTESEKYTEFSQIEALVKEIYTDEAAEKILTATEVVTADGTAKTIRIYEDHNIHGDTFLGMNTEFTPNKDYKTDWSNCFIVAEPLSADKCSITVYVDGVSVENAESFPESVLKTEMIKTDGGWRFTEFLK